MNGKEVKTICFSGKQLIVEKEVLPVAVYFFEITSENKNIMSKKIIIQ